MRRLVVGLLLLIAARLAVFAFFPLAAEDAFISFHAALDPAFHAATTSPLWVLMVMPDPEVFARFWSLLGDCGAVYAAWRFLPMWGFWAFLAFWVSPFFTGSAVSGLETHLAACALLAARIHPAGYFLAAALRPDTALLALCSSGRKVWWAAFGIIAMFCVNGAFAGHFLPQTITSKALSYGVHPGAWGWLHPYGFGWMTVALGVALGYAAISKSHNTPRAVTAAGRYILECWPESTYPLSKRLPWLHVGAAVAFLATHVALGTPTFAWWYAVPPLAMLGLAAASSVNGPKAIIAAALVMVAFAPWQVSELFDRLTQERNLWVTGKQLAALKPRGTILLEPAGMIPYQNPQLKVIDDVGLIDPWMAERRRTKGWRTAAIEHYKPDWLVIRAREYLQPDAWTIGDTPPYNNVTESRLQGYRLVFAPGLETTPNGRFKISMEASSLIVLKRR